MLLLRKKAEPILENYGLGKMYLTSHNSGTSIYPVLMTGCGVRLKDFYELAMSNLKGATDEEVDYAITLFSKWLGNHHSILQEYIATNQKIQESTDTLDKLNKENAEFFKTVQYYRNTKLETSYISINSGKKTGIKYNVYGDGELRVSIMDKGNPKDLIESLSKYKFKKVDECVQRIQLLWEKGDLDSTKRSLLSKLNSCKI